MSEIVHARVHHDRERRSQLVELSRSLAWAGMGAARRFCDPDV